MNAPVSLIFARYAGKKDRRMTMEYVDLQYKEVYFDQYCISCKYSDLEEENDPCNTCLANPANEYSHKPIYWKPKE